MDSAADSLLALSNTAAALREGTLPQDDDDRSSSLSELDGELEEDGVEDEDDDLNDDEEADDDEAGDDEDVEGTAQEDTPSRQVPADVDSEAETERLEESPDKLGRKKSFIATPSKLAQPLVVNHSPNERPEIESLTESPMSSPVSSRSDSDDELSDVPADAEAEDPTEAQTHPGSPTKRKREGQETDEEEKSRIRRRRTHSLASDEGRSDRESGREDGPSRGSRDRSAEPAGEAEEGDEEQSEDGDRAQATKGNEQVTGKKRAPPSRLSSRRRGKDDQPQESEQDDDAEAGDESDEAEADDVDTVAKSEEEQVKRMAAMEGLGILEKHFAALRDRLYDERIAAINQELQQLAEPEPSHPEFLRQLEAVRKYRDEKFETEQKLLVYRIGALKNKSVAERSQIHSQYFQEVRDMREKHLERLSEHFYRIQRERFKSDAPIPSYSIPFVTKRSKQIIHQTAYNKEVSILSGIAKYVGFPAAPELAKSSQAELDEDLQKMGVSLDEMTRRRLLTDDQIPAQIRQPRPVHRVTSAFSNISGPAAEEQFLEKNPWANAQHPMHKLGMSRQDSNRSPLPDATYLTPANQQRVAATSSGAVGSASTIAEFPSSQNHTPHENSVKNEQQLSFSYKINSRRQDTASPLDVRRTGQAVPEVETASRENHSSPLTPRPNHGSSPTRPALAMADTIAGRTADSTSIGKTPGITTGPGFGMGRF
jgi:hypothetical protein